MIIDCISDLHGYYPKLKGGDLLIVAGDLTANDRGKQYEDFNTWLLGQEYHKKIIIAGNHDEFMTNNDTANLVCMGAEYLCDSGTEFQGLKIWGSPWSLWFPGINPKCTAFTTYEFIIHDFYEKIPNNIDILITHTPPYGILDKTKNDKLAGSKSLREAFFRVKPKLHVFGHIHEQGGKKVDLVTSICVNASIVDEHYKHVNKPVRVEL